jgi:hypothetical protein
MNDGGAPPGGNVPRKRPPSDGILQIETYFFTPSSSFTENLSC